MDWAPKLLLLCLLAARMELGDEKRPSASPRRPAAPRPQWVRRCGALLAALPRCRPRCAAPAWVGKHRRGTKGAEGGWGKVTHRGGGQLLPPKTLPAGSPGGAAISNGPAGGVREKRPGNLPPGCPVPPARSWEHPRARVRSPRSISDPGFLPHGPRAAGGVAGGPRGARLPGGASTGGALRWLSTSRICGAASPPYDRGVFVLINANKRLVLTGEGRRKMFSSLTPACYTPML